MTYVRFYKGIKALLHINSYFPSNSEKKLTFFLSEFYKMEIREDNSHTTMLSDRHLD